MKCLVLGGARSGKSRYAESLACASGLDVAYIATARAADDEMAGRIARHRSGRPAHWAVIEEPLQLADALDEVSRPTRCVIVDCLTLWLGNLYSCSEARRAAQIDALYSILPALAGRTILVSNEVGLGIVPDNALARHFRDTAGLLHQRLASLCETVELVVSGVPLCLSERRDGSGLSLEISMCDPDGGNVRRIGVAIASSSPPTAMLPQPFRERLLEEGVDLDSLNQLAREAGEQPLFELESGRGRVRIEIRRSNRARAGDSNGSGL